MSEMEHIQPFLPPAFKSSPSFEALDVSGPWPLATLAYAIAVPLFGVRGSHPGCVLLLIHHTSKLLANSLSYLRNN